jgi:hypothetical protein
MLDVSGPIEIRREVFDKSTRTWTLRTDEAQIQITTIVGKVDDISAESDDVEYRYDLSL